MTTFEKCLLAILFATMAALGYALSFDFFW